MNEKIRFAKTAGDIESCRAAILELRPHLAGADLVALVQDMISEGFHLAYIEADDGNVAAICGYRYLQKLFNGKHFYIDDLGTLPAYRGRGYAGALLDFVFQEAKQRGFEMVTLDSGHQRHTAHRLYLNKGFSIAAHHFSKKMSSETA